MVNAAALNDFFGSLGWILGSALFLVHIYKQNHKHLLLISAISFLVGSIFFLISALLRL